LQLGQQQVVFVQPDGGHTTSPGDATGTVPVGHVPWYEVQVKGGAQQSVELQKLQDVVPGIGVKFVGQVVDAAVIEHVFAWQQFDWVQPLAAHGAGFASAVELGPQGNGG